MIVCPCGCGEWFSPLDSRGRPRRYFAPGCSLRVNNYMKLNLGNPFKGRRHTAATKATLSEKASIPKPHLRGAGNGMFGRSGPLNPRYVDGSSPERQRAYSSQEWKQASRAARKRDGHVCRDCGSRRRGLHLHHIKPWAGFPESRYDVDNLISLCADCHRARHARGGDANE